MAITLNAFCKVCQCPQSFDDSWWAIRADYKGRFIAEPASEDHLAFDCDLVCGQGHALILFERYLQSGSFAVPHTLPQAAEPAFV